MIYLFLGIAVLFILAAVLTLGACILFDAAVVAKPSYPDYADSEAFVKYIDKINAGREWTAAQAPEDVYIKSHDGLKLHGYYLPCEGAKTAVIFMHGYHSTALGDSSCIAKMYHERGYSLLLPEQRAHGGSEGRYITFGVLERHDAKSWAEYLNNRLGGKTKIIMQGISMGASTVLYSCGLGLPKSVCAVIADCGFTSPYDEFAHVLKTAYNLPAFPIIGIAQAIAKRRAHFGFHDADTASALENCRLPMLFIHGTGDKYVPFEMGQWNYELCRSENKLFVPVEGAGHGESYLLAPDVCNAALDGFLKSL